MRQADFPSMTMSGLASNLQPAVATIPTKAASSTAPASAGSNFAALFGDVRADVNEFIQHGSSDFGSPAMSAMSTLSAEGQAYRERLRSTMPAAATDDADTAGAQQGFLASIAPWAQEAGVRLGVSADLVAAHAALESGWGRHPLRQANGSDTHNLFALKSAGNWRGSVAPSLTTEYENGSAVKKTETFRSYPDQASAFKDYAQLLLNNPRYRSALNAGSDAHAFAQGLARGGYATDPAYAGKLARVADQVQTARKSVQAGAAATQAAAAAAKIDQSGD
ncbi:flagellar assembly peptidoglycan hydrolase FlgJ [Undibacterium sp.]|jgi:flagellar protein FlgJ|uniref:flagellar assembly peptidoglycan hydrolase FlgJ n=1 Tax=Undibacterium sp. TaxID=1914977 RepID=UPI002B9876B8|nr:flagellar assembly peptidoglycan hydrolase FlgJ [Undibacterium sp.]HTD04156.1 flagellar assembly peptidoglycan hydrolase FlgJ [Undibacterium sp.]